jgi:3-methyladenine DNA glycosylase/8-oxoguanine DNA glycosylase
MKVKKQEHLRFVGKYRLPVRSPFNFRYTFWKPSHFQTELEYHTKLASWRTFRLGPTICGVRFEMDKREIVATVYEKGPWSDKICDRLLKQINMAYGLSEDISPFLRAADREPLLNKAVKNLRGMRISCPENIFEIAIVSLLLQNTTVNRTEQMMFSLLDRYGKLVEFDGVTLRCFFSPKDMLKVTEEELREKCRLGYRAKYLPEFAKYFSAAKNDNLRDMNQESAIAELKKIRGVGPYTADVITSHALRSHNTVALDVWNTKIISLELFGSNDVCPDMVRDKLNKIIPGYAGLTTLYIIENNYISI